MMFATVLAALAYTLTPSYLQGTWIEPGSGATCTNGMGYIFGKKTIRVDEDDVPYVIKGDRVYYMGVDTPTYDEIKVVDKDVMLLRVQNAKKWATLYRCSR